MNTKIAYKITTKTKPSRPSFLFILIAASLLAISGCQSVPTEQGYAAQFAANLQYVSGDPYVHATYVNPAAFEIQTKRQSKGQFLHVYIEGDGKAFVNGKVSVNPTPDNPLLLKLMQQDDKPAIYLGRPCYFNPKDEECSPNVWTRHRYSDNVVNSMARALHHFSSDYEHLVFIGHSGGGTIATLLAERISQTSMVVTMAANLDTFSWALEHQYQPLKESLNPIDRPLLPSNILQVHYAGADDIVIDADWIEAYADKQHRAEFHRLLAVEHVDGWEEFWPQVLEKLNHYQQFVKP